MLEQVIGPSWVSVLQSEFDHPYMQKLAAWLSYTRQSKTIYPESEDVFRAFKECPYGQVKVVILGQNPYHQPNVADGLAFSFKGGIKHLSGMQALDVILDEIERDCYDGFNVNKDYDLTYLAKQGVLLLNSWLTVFKGDPNSHKDIGWQRFVQKVLLTQIQEKTNKVFLLWGREAQKLYDETIALDESINGWSNYRHLVLKTYHPASDLYNRDSMGNITKVYPDGFTGCKHFSQANEFLIKEGNTPIEWLNTAEPFMNPFLAKYVEDKGYPKDWDL